MSPLTFADFLDKHLADSALQPYPTLSLTAAQARLKVEHLGIVRTSIVLDADLVVAALASTGGIPEAFGIQLFTANFRMDVLASRIIGNYTIDNSDHTGGEVGLGTTAANAETGATADFGTVGTAFETILEGGVPALATAGAGDVTAFKVSDGYRGRIGTGSSTSHNVCLNFVLAFGDAEGGITVKKDTRIDIWHIPLNMSSTA
jgi:hypothetical protein